VGKFLLFCLVVLCAAVCAHPETSVQSSWYLGPGVEGPLTDWDESFWTSESIAYSVEGLISLSAERSDPDAWTRHVIDDAASIDGHANILPADLDGDGVFELVSILYGAPGRVVWYEPTTSGFVRNDIGPFSNDPLGTTWPYDMDKDGDIDVVASGAEGLVWFANEAGVFTKKLIDVSLGYLYARPGDVDNDNDVDIVVHDMTHDNMMHGDLWLFRNDGTLNFTRELIFDVTGDDMWRVNLGDLNGDDYLDIQTSGEPLRVFLNDGTGTFWLKFTFNDTIHVDGSWLNDFDRDGDLDIMGAHWGYAGYYPRPLFWFENDGSGMVFDYHPIGGDNGDYGGGGMAIDINLDGLMDALGAYRLFGWFEQLPGGGFLEHHFPFGGVANSHWIYGENLEGGHCTGDVDIDVLASDYGAFYLWENQMVTFFKEGRLTSSILDAEEPAEWMTFGWSQCEPPECANEYYVRSGETVPGIESAPWIGPLAGSGDSLKDYGVADGRYFQYQVVLRNLTAPDDISPSVEEVWVTYDVQGCDPVEPWQVRTQGYWKRQCKNKPHEDICAYVDSIHVLADLFDSFDCDSVCGLMRIDPPENDMCRKARRQFMALLLNIASGKLAVCNCLEDGREVGDVVADIDSILANFSNHESCVTAKTLADDLNNGIGLVPCDSLYHAGGQSSASRIVHGVSPNPFARTTTIHYQIPLESAVRLSIYDHTGRLIKVLVDGIQESGANLAEWDGLNEGGLKMPNGIYFYMLEANGSTESGKIILLK
jgi:hypothetical protein